MIGSSIGHRLVLTSIGESHGRMVGAILDGCPAGLDLDESDIQWMLDQRRPGQSPTSTQRKEKDRVEITSGTLRGNTTGAPITMLIWNEDQRPQDYDEMKAKLRPGHSDYPAMVKYSGYNDHRGGGRFSGRLTATHVMGGAVARKLLGRIGVRTDAYTVQIGTRRMRNPFSQDMAELIYENDARCPEADTADAMRSDILATKRSGDSLGGIIESTTTGVPVGLGEPIFDSLESDIAKAIFSIPSVKGVEFGSGFAGSGLRGSENNDSYAVSDGRIVTRTNNAGGILGGLATGMPIVMRAAFKPASSIQQDQKTVNPDTMEETTIKVAGRHDPCVVPRAPPVVDALVSLTIADHAIISGMLKQVL